MPGLIVCRVQHHPTRAHLLPALKKALKPLPVEVRKHASDPPNPWQGYRRCLLDLPECSHVLVIQDDAVPCQNFAAAVERIAASNPDAPVALFLARLPREAARKATDALKSNRRYVTFSFRSFVPVVALLWPKPVAEQFMAWADSGVTLPGNVEPRSDDAIVGRYQALTRQEFRACVPSLVEHPDMEPSLIGRRRSWGLDKGRVAHHLVEGDPLQYEW